MADAYLNQNPDKESDYRGKVKENDYSVIPKLKDDFHDVFAELEKELAKDQMGDVDVDDDAADTNLVQGKPSKNEEVLPNIGYALRPHNVKKHPSELNGRQDSFENPYARPQYPAAAQPIQPAGYPSGGYPPQQGYPQYPQYPQYPVPQVGGGYGRRKRRAKRQTSGTDDTYDAHWGIHRIMSTGKWRTMW